MQQLDSFSKITCYEIHFLKATSQVHTHVRGRLSGQKIAMALTVGLVALTGGVQ